MSLTRITRGMLDNGAVTVPGNIYATGVASSSTYLRGDGQWATVSGSSGFSSNQSLFTTSSVVFAALTVTNTIISGGLISNGYIKLANLTVTNTIISDTLKPNNIIFSDGSSLSSFYNLSVTWDHVYNMAGVNTGPASVIIGYNAPFNGRGEDHYTPFADIVSLGKAGNAGDRTIAIGAAFAQNQDSIAIGTRALVYGDSSVGIGHNVFAGGDNVIAIGSSIGLPSGNGSVHNSITLNASGSEFNAPSSGFFVKPIANKSTSQAIYYNPTTGELSYAAAGGGNPFNQSLNTTDNVTFNHIVTTNTVDIGGTTPTGTPNPASQITVDSIKGHPYKDLYISKSTTGSGRLFVNTDIVPTNINSVLGAPGSPWKHLYVSSNSISFVDTTNTETFTTSTLSILTGTIHINDLPLVNQSVTIGSAPVFALVTATTAVTVNNYTLPTADGSTGNVVATDGAGQLNFYASTFMTWMNFDGGSAASIYSIADPSIEGGASNSNYQGFNIDAGHAAYA